MSEVVVADLETPKVSLAERDLETHGFSKSVMKRDRARSDASYDTVTSLSVTCITDVQAAEAMSILAAYAPLSLKSYPAGGTAEAALFRESPHEPHHDG